MRRDLVQSLIPVLVLALLWLAGCVREREPSPVSEPRWLHWAVQDAPNANGPCREKVCLRWASLSGRGLVDLEVRNGALALAPALAAEWRWLSPTRLSLTLSMTTRWSDGARLESGQFLDTWRRLLLDCRQQRNAALLFPVVNAEAFCERKVPFSQVGLRAVDGRTLLVELSAPTIAFPRVFAHPALWPWRGPELAVGPFLPPKAERGGWYRVARNPHHRREPGTIEGLRIQVEPSAENRIARFHEGALELVDDIPDALAPRLKGDPQAESWRTGRRTVLAFHTGRRPFTELVARQVFAAAIAREEPLKLLRRPDWIAAGFFWPAHDDAKQRGPAPREASQNLARLKTLPYDPATVHLTIAWTSFPGAAALAENLIAQWAKELRLRVDPAGGGVEGEVPMSGATMTLMEIDERVLTPWRALSRFAIGHPEIESRLHKASRARDEAELAAALEAAESLIADKAVIAIPLLAHGRTVLRAPKLRRLAQSPLGAWEFASAAIE